MTDTDTDDVGLVLDVEITSEGISLFIENVFPTTATCPDCDGDGCDNCDDVGIVHVADSETVTEWWAPWAELVSDGESWSAFQDVDIEYTNVTRAIDA